jgi:hypothetical protein
VLIERANVVIEGSDQEERQSLTVPASLGQLTDLLIVLPLFFIKQMNTLGGTYSAS